MTGVIFDHEVYPEALLYGQHISTESIHTMKAYIGWTTFCSRQGSASLEIFCHVGADTQFSLSCNEAFISGLHIYIPCTAG